MAANSAQSPIRALDAPLEEDLSGLVHWLARAGVPHRVHEESGRQVLLVLDEAGAAQARDGLAQLRAGTLQVPRRSTRPLLAPAQLAAQAARLPVTLGLGLLCLLVFPATWALDSDGPGTLLTALTFVPVQVVGDFLRIGNLGDTLGGQWWRLWTPTLLHFGVMHLVFNLVFLWVLGLRVELAHGGRRLLVLVLATGLAANLAQHLTAEGPLFGGLSGVLYGLLGYLLVAVRRDPDPRLVLPQGLAVGLLVMLVLFSTNVTSLFGLHIGNGSHWGGLAAGILAGVALVPGGAGHNAGDGT